MGWTLFPFFTVTSNKERLKVKDASYKLRASKVSKNLNVDDNRLGRSKQEFRHGN